MLNTLHHIKFSLVSYVFTRKMFDSFSNQNFFIFQKTHVVEKIEIITAIITHDCVAFKTNSLRFPNNTLTYYHKAFNERSFSTRILWLATLEKHVTHQKWHPWSAPFQVILLEYLVIKCIKMTTFWSQIY